MNDITFPILGWLYVPYKNDMAYANPDMKRYISAAVYEATVTN